MSDGFSSCARFARLRAFKYWIKILELQEVADEAEDRPEHPAAQFYVKVERNEIEPEPELRLIAGVAHLVSGYLMFNAPAQDVAEFHEIEMVFVSDRIVQANVIVDEDILRHDGEEECYETAVNPP